MRMRKLEFYEIFPHCYNLRVHSPAHLGILGLGNVDKDLSAGVDDVEKLHNSSAIIGDGSVALVVVDQLVHPPGTQRRPHHIRHRHAGIDVAHDLRLPLGRVRPFLQQYDLRLLQSSTKPPTTAEKPVNTANKQVERPPRAAGRLTIIEAIGGERWRERVPGLGFWSLQFSRSSAELQDGE